MIEGHGDDIYRYKSIVRHNFSSNIYQHMNHEALCRHLAMKMPVIANYPEPAPVTVEMALAERLGIAADNIAVTNGAADAIYLIAKAFEGSRSAVMQPTFSEYADACKVNNHKTQSFSNIEDIPQDAEIVWICNPNNPTGTVIPEDKLIGYISKNRNKIFVIDQAYHLYTQQNMLSPQICQRFNNCILIYSLTKDYGIPGLRIGHVISSNENISKIKHYRIPWSVNSLAIEAAKFLLSDNGCEMLPIGMLLDETRRLANEMNAIGIATSESQTNFILCHLPQGTAAELKAYLIKNHGILIRDASNFESLTPQHFRVASQTPEENDLLINAIKRWMLLC